MQVSRAGSNASGANEHSCISLAAWIAVQRGQRFACVGEQLGPGAIDWGGVAPAEKQFHIGYRHVPPMDFAMTWPRRCVINDSARHATAKR